MRIHYASMPVEDKHFCVLPREKPQDGGLWTTMVLFLQLLRSETGARLVHEVPFRQVPTHKINTFFCETNEITGTYHREHMLIPLHQTLHKHRFTAIVLKELFHFSRELFCVVTSDGVDAHGAG